MAYQHDGHTQEKTLSVGEIRVENKNIRASIKENHRGRFMRITEETRGKHSTVIIPYGGVVEFLALLGQVSEDAGPE